MFMRQSVRLSVVSTVLLTAACATVGGYFYDPPATKLNDSYRGVYELDRHHANLYFRVSYLGLTQIMGRFNDFNARLFFDGVNTEKSKVTATIETKSLDSQDASLKAALIGVDFLDSVHFPQLTFATEAIVWHDSAHATVNGIVTLRGISRPITLNVTFNGGGVSLLDGRKRLGFSAEAKLRRSEFGMTANQWLVGDTVELLIETELVRAGELAPDELRPAAALRH